MEQIFNARILQTTFKILVKVASIFCGGGFILFALKNYET